MARPKGSKNIPKDLAVIAPDNTDNIKPEIKIVNAGGRPVRYTLDELKHSIALYFDNCECNGKSPKWQDLLLFLDISDDTLLNYRSNKDDKYVGYSDAIKKAELRLSCFWQQYALDHPNLQSYCMFQLKQPHNGGFIDRPKDEKADMTIQVNLGFDGKKAE